MIEGYKSVAETAKQWNISTRRVRTMCASGCIEGAAKLGREWAIPSDADKPTDKRIITGKYKNWRKAEEK